MSTLEQREQLIQQRQAEKYVNVIRFAVLVFLAAVLFLRSQFQVPLNALLLVLTAFAYSLLVVYAVSRGYLPRYLPWLTTVADLFFFVVGFSLEINAFRDTPDALIGAFSWGYALLLLLILFSTLRERPSLTLLNGGLAAVIYACFIFWVAPVEPFRGFWLDQVFRLGFLILAGLFSWFHARSLRKAFRRAADSDKLRRETDARLQLLARHFPGVLFQAEFTGRELRLLFVSEGSRNLLGIEPRKLVLNPSDFFARTGGILLRELRQRASLKNEPQNWETEFRYDRGDRKLWLKMTVSTHLEHRAKQVFNGLLTDISEQKAVESALKEANQVKTDFLATMSHELRTPLNAILGNADFLTRLAETDEDKRAFRDILGSGETLLGIIDDILVFSRLEAGKLSLNLRPFRWRDQLELLADTFRPMVQEKKISFSIEEGSDVPETVISDVLRFRQILANLIGNAVKFTTEGSVVIAVRYDNGRLIVSVKDTGVGIPEEAQERIFEKFVQADQSKSRPFGGTGLGLAISRSLTQLMEGRLTVQSEQGKGSEFVLTLPVKTQAEPAALASGPEEKGMERRPQKVLLVEDNATNQDVAVRMLTKLGAEVELAVSGFQAVEKAEKSDYDLVFMDWQMPGMDGKEATARIRSLKNGPNFKIIALSGHALPGDKELLLASGFDDYLSKPVRMDDFRAILEKYT